MYQNFVKNGLAQLTLLCRSCISWLNFDLPIYSSLSTAERRDRSYYYVASCFEDGEIRKSISKEKTHFFDKFEEPTYKFSPL